MKEQTYVAMIEGRIRVYRKYPDGRVCLVVDRHNVITFRAADILSKVLGGDITYIPSRIGMIYAADDKSFVNPGTNRTQEWGTIASDVLDQGGNMIICSLASPTFSVLGDTDVYSGNVATLSTMSDKDAPRAFSTGGYDANPPASGKKYFQVVLLARTFLAGSSTPVYTPYAIAQLTDTTDGLVIEDNTELVVYWSLAFK